LVEIRNRDEFVVYHETSSVVDAYLRGRSARPEVRMRKEGGFEVLEVPVPTLVEEPPKRRRREREEPAAVATGGKTLRIYPYGVSKDRLMRAINDLQVSATIAKTPKDADVVLTLKAHEKRQPRTVKDLADQGLEVAIIRSNTVSQMKAFLMGAFGLEDQRNEEESAISEVTEAVDKVMSFGKPVELAPQSAHIRRLQHQLIEQRGLGSESRGEVPWRRVIVLPTRG
jgi:R3H domain